MRSPFPRKKSKLGPQGKTIAAALVLLDVMDEKIDAQAAGLRLRQEVGLQWSFITCLQYMSGKEALGAVEALPNDWTQDGRTKTDVILAVVAAAHTVANVRSDGTMLCASDLAEHFKGVDLSSSVG
ncbi:hypothetical protein [Dyella sp. Tek66A03]|uniref:hypothetical protein n=1 Tax=Dyella sp. Tek66A03 TaxID=3458298 RepID=UPI00403ED0A2